MPRPMLLVFLLIILIITSQFEWKQSLVNDIEATPTMSQKQQLISKREEVLKEKIILSQEKNIQRLNEVVRSLREELLQCQNKNENKRRRSSVDTRRLDPGDMVHSFSLPNF